MTESKTRPIKKRQSPRKDKVEAPSSTRQDINQDKIESKTRLSPRQDRVPDKTESKTRPSTRQDRVQTPSRPRQDRVHEKTVSKTRLSPNAQRQDQDLQNQHWSLASCSSREGLSKLNALRTILRTNTRRATLENGEAVVWFERPQKAQMRGGIDFYSYSLDSAGP
ncbi:hypothetical protein WMY93_022488 [Mugilogobius chulae]|uniref:Uncharacterized protein n=1 Tax=Mugilogobius chulae TaxID=88201 RepID=A0AAW0NJF8_9GOBI